MVEVTGTEKPKKAPAKRPKARQSKTAEPALKKAAKPAAKRRRSKWVKKVDQTSAWVNKELELSLVYGQ